MGLLGVFLGASWTVFNGVKAEKLDMVTMYVFPRDFQDSRF